MQKVVLVAALHDADEGGDGLVLGFAIEDVFFDRDLTAFFLGGVDNLAFLAGEEGINVLAGAVKFLGAEHEVDIRETINQLGTAALGHAAHEPEFLAGLAFAGIADKGVHLVDRLLLDHVADAAGVQQHYVHDRLVISQRIALGDELGGNGFRCRACPSGIRRF